MVKFPLLIFVSLVLFELEVELLEEVVGSGLKHSHTQFCFLGFVYFLVFLEVSLSSRLGAGKTAEYFGKANFCIWCSMSFWFPRNERVS